MRSRFVYRLCAAAFCMSACLLTVNSNCFAQNQFGSEADCGCSDGGSGDCGCSGNFGDGPPCGLSGLRGLRLPSFGRAAQSDGSCGGGCDTCNGGNRRLFLSNPLERGPATGVSMLSRGAACGAGCSGCAECGGGGLFSRLSSIGSGIGTGKVRGRLASAGARAGSRLAGGACDSCGSADGGCGCAGMGGGGLLSHGFGGGMLSGGLHGFGHGAHGCGHGGCGIGGRGLCSSCLSRSGLRGQIPHTSQPNYGMGGMGGGGQAPTYAYPYYTTRAPRDFLMDNPPTIGY